VWLGRSSEYIGAAKIVAFSHPLISFKSGTFYPRNINHCVMKARPEASELDMALPLFAMYFGRGGATIKTIRRIRHATDFYVEKADDALRNVFAADSEGTRHTVRISESQNFPLDTSR